MADPLNFTNTVHEVGVLIQAQNVWNGTPVKEKQWPVKALPHLNLPGHSIMGRGELLEQVIEAFEQGKRNVVLLHLPGVGKTTMAALLAGDKRIHERFADGVLWADVGPEPKLISVLRNWAAKVGITEEVMKQCGDDEVRWRDEISQAIAERRLLLVIDNVWDVRIGKALSLGGENCGHLYTTRKPAVAVRLARERFNVGALSAEQGFELLSAYAPSVAKAHPEALKELVRLVGGLPLALELMGHRLEVAGQFNQQELIALELERLEDVKRRLTLEMPDDRTDQTLTLASVIETSYQMLGSDGFDTEAGDLRHALNGLSILRPDTNFCLDLAQRVTGLTREAAYATLNGLANAGLVEVAILPPDATSESDDEDDDIEAQAQPREAYSIHRTIAEYIRNEKLPPETRQALHLKAAAFYSERLAELEEAFQHKQKGYERWYLYERRDWQECKEDWLYHLARADAQRQVMVAFLRTWFDGFWWWGCFLDFEFCEQLLHEWGQRKLVPEAKHGLRLLKQFMDAYPKETVARSGNWKKVEHLLTEVRSGAQLEGDPAELDEDSRHVRGLTGIFLAEARRFGKQRDIAGAEALYRDALDQFERNEDQWDTAWTLYHLADMLTGNGRSDEANPLCERALALDETAKDPEVQANLQRVLGDAARLRGDYDAATAHYHEAVRQAFRFQADPELPDPYTVRFYTQIAELVAARLVALEKERHDEALQMSRRLHQAWHHGTPDPEADAMLHGADPGQLAQWLFLPSAPAELLDLPDPGAKKDYANWVRTSMQGLRAP